MPHPAPGSRHLLWIEAARTLAMAVVVWSHASNLLYFREGDFTPVPLFSACLVTFAVPTFFLISGYLLGRGGSGRPAEAARASRPLRQIRKLTPPFLAWNALTIVSLKLLYGVPLFTWGHLGELLYGSMQLYFIFAMLQFLALLTVVDPFATPRRLAAWTAGAWAVTLAFYAFSSLLAQASPPRDSLFELVGIRLAPAWGGFFFLGAWLSRHETVFAALTRRLSWLLGAAVLALTVYLAVVVAEARSLGANYRQYFLLSGLAFQIAGALAVCCACRHIEARGGGRVFAWLAAAGRDTLGIYLAHYVLVLAFAAAIAPPIPAVWRLPLGVASMIVAFGGSLLLTRLARRFAAVPGVRLFFPVS